jgi:hypothetical protein
MPPNSILISVRTLLFILMYGARRHSEEEIDQPQNTRNTQKRGKMMICPFSFRAFRVFRGSFSTAVYQGKD